MSATAEIQCSGGPMDGAPVAHSELVGGQLIKGIRAVTREVGTYPMTQRLFFNEWSTSGYDHRVVYRMEPSGKLIFQGYYKGI
jgi:hypothetical protein